MKFIVQVKGYGKIYYERERRKKKMKDEIKLWKEKTKGIFHITEYTRFWNYITNLQQENERLKENNQKMQEEMSKTWEKLDKPHYSEIKHYKFLRDIKDIIRDREVGYMETCDTLETVINKELEKYE